MKKYFWMSSAAVMIGALSVKDAFYFVLSFKQVFCFTYLEQMHKYIY